MQGKLANRGFNVKPLYLNHILFALAKNSYCNQLTKNRVQRDSASSFVKKYYPTYINVLLPVTFA